MPSPASWRTTHVSGATCSGSQKRMGSSWFMVVVPRGGPTFAVGVIGLVVLFSQQRLVADLERTWRAAASGPPRAADHSTVISAYMPWWKWGTPASAGG